VSEICESYTIDKLRPVEYEINDRHDMGFIAHEVQELFPFLVSGDKDGNTLQNLNYNGLIALIIKELKEVKQELSTIKERIYIGETK
jgi:hypothetical protein